MPEQAPKVEKQKKRGQGSQKVRRQCDEVKELIKSLEVNGVYIKNGNIQGKRNEGMTYIGAAGRSVIQGELNVKFLKNRNFYFNLSMFQNNSKKLL